MINVTGKKQNKTSLLALKHRCNVFDMRLLNSQSGHSKKLLLKWENSSLQMAFRVSIYELLGYSFKQQVALL